MSSFTKSVLKCKNCIENVTSIYGYPLRMFSKDATVSQLPLKETNEEKLKKAKPYKDMPKVPMLPFFGSSWAYFPIIGKYSSKKIHKADLLKHKVYGDVVRERFGNFELVSSYDPQTMLILAANEGIYPARAEFTTLKEYRQKRKHWFQPLGLVVLQGKEWYDFRKRLQSYVLSPITLKTYLQPIHDVSKDFVGLIRMKRDPKKEVDDVMKYLYKWALESICYVALDTRLGCLDPNLSLDSDGMKMINAVQTQLACMNILEASSGNFPFWKYFSTPTWRKFVRAADEFTRLAFQYIHYALSDYAQDKVEEQKTLLQKLLMQEKLDFSAAMVAVSDIIMAGIDTTSHAAGFLLYNLARNPEKQEIAYQEILSLLPNKEQKITHEIAGKVKYVKWCLKESLRLHPVVRGNLRILNTDVVVNGYRVPAGTAIICVLQVVYRNEKYFKNADQFIPERWDNNSDSSIAFRPFGHGKRSCIGRFMAQQEILSLVIEVLRNFSLEYHYEDVDMYSRLINIPDKPLRIRFLER